MSCYSAYNVLYAAIVRIIACIIVKEPINAYVELICALITAYLLLIGYNTCIAANDRITGYHASNSA